MWQSDIGLIRITFQIYLVNLILFTPCSPLVYFDNAYHLSQNYNLPIFCRFCLSLPHHLTSLNTTSAGHSIFATTQAHKVMKQQSGGDMIEALQLTLLRVLQIFLHLTAFFIFLMTGLSLLRLFCLPVKQFQW